MKKTLHCRDCGKVLDRSGTIYCWVYFGHGQYGGGNELVDLFCSRCKPSYIEDNLKPCASCGTILRTNTNKIAACSSSCLSKAIA